MCRQRPYFAFAKNDAALQTLLRGAVRMQANFVNIDPYANAHYADALRVSPWTSDTTTFLSFAGCEAVVLVVLVVDRLFIAPSFHRSLSIARSALTRRP